VKEETVEAGEILHVPRYPVFVFRRLTDKAMPHGWILYTLFDCIVKPILFIRPCRPVNTGAAISAGNRFLDHAAVFVHPLQLVSLMKTLGSADFAIRLERL
jgi:hypothetical protein